MARMPGRAAAEVYDAAAQFVERGLRSDDSLFTPGIAIWTAGNFDELQARYVENLDLGDRKFWVKLEDQLAAAPAAAVQLAAELLYIHLLITTSMKGATKRNDLKKVLDWAGTGVQIPPDLQEALDQGLVRAGRGFNAHFRQLKFLIEFGRDWKKSLDDPVREWLLEDPYRFRDHLLETADSGSMSQALALLHLVFPDTFERIISADHKRLIIEIFGDRTTSDDPDQQVAEIRASFEDELGKPFDFYDDPEFRARWDPTARPDADGDDDEPPSLSDVIEQVLELQLAYDWTSTPEMVQRGKLIRGAGVEAVKALLPPAETLPYTVSVEGRDNQGRRSKVPWIRAFSKVHSPSATVGWYVTYLFAADGSAAWLSLNQGAMEPEDTDRPRPADYLEERVRWARSVLKGKLPSQWGSSIDLADPGPRSPGRAYEAGNVAAVRYGPSEVPDDDQLAKDLGEGLSLLTELYDKEGGASGGDGSSDEESSGQPLHLLLKWTPTDTPDTRIDHQRIAEVHGSVWWGNLTASDRRVPESRIAQLREQMGTTPTFVYFFRTGPDPEVSRARLAEVTTDPDAVDPDLVPAQYRPDEGNYNIWVRVGDFEAVDLDSFFDRVVLASKPISGSVKAGLRNQTSPLYVNVLREEPGDPAASQYGRQWLLDTTLWEADVLDEVLDVLLGDQPQLILAGPPGTGKTWVARALAQYLTRGDRKRWRLVQFHPSYSYESFVEGLRPVVDEDGAIRFDTPPGDVLRLAKAVVETDASHVLVIDEMNRANIPRVFGELMFLLEYRDEMIDLQYTKGFSLPTGIAFIATMNTADRSIRALDVALRRRFEIFECLPDATILDDYYAKGRGVNYVGDLIDGFQALNKALEDELDRHHTIGQTFFMKSELTYDGLKRVWDRKLAPLIEEYFFDTPDLAREFSIEKFWSKSS